ncbi:MAG: hypothetical protein N4A63_10460 [Vallitalea sp.]|jgi:hypothetical protein|nr:hypothetical protein [Vallitalea sp.]
MRFVYILASIIAITIIFTSCHQSKNTRDATMENQNIIDTKSFSVATDSTELNTSVKGTIFIEGKKEIPEHIQIVAFIDIDDNDWGGIEFYIPKKWDISKIISSYPENKSQIKPEDYVVTLTTKSEKYKWDKFIQIGYEESYMQTVGGTGTIVIDLNVDKDKIKQLDKSNITIVVGSDEKKGIKIKGTDSVSIDIDIPK